VLVGIPVGVALGVADGVAVGLAVGVGLAPGDGVVPGGAVAGAGERVVVALPHADNAKAASTMDAIERRPARRTRARRRLETANMARPSKDAKEILVSVVDARSVGYGGKPHPAGENTDGYVSCRGMFAAWEAPPTAAANVAA
jgi:hypothetical protein